MASSGNDQTNNILGSSRPAMGATRRAAITPTQSARFQSIATMRTYLLTQGYTNAQLDIMTENDINRAVVVKSGI